MDGASKKKALSCCYGMEFDLLALHTDWVGLGWGECIGTGQGLHTCKIERGRSRLWEKPVLLCIRMPNTANEQKFEKLSSLEQV
jgi:hypothetical protein